MSIELWICVAVIAVYLAIRAVSYSYFFEKWKIVDSLYFTMVTCVYNTSLRVDESCNKKLGTVY